MTAELIVSFHRTHDPALDTLSLPSSLFQHSALGSDLDQERRTDSRSGTRNELVFLDDQGRMPFQSDQRVLVLKRTTDLQEPVTFGGKPRLGEASSASRARRATVRCEKRFTVDRPRSWTRSPKRPLYA